MEWSKISYQAGPWRFRVDETLFYIMVFGIIAECWNLDVFLKSRQPIAELAIV